MDEDKVKAMEAELRLKKMELDLIQAIDKIRDEAAEPGALLVSTVDFLADWFKVDLCLLFLLDRETGAAELKAARDPQRETRRVTKVDPARICREGDPFRRGDGVG